MTENATPPPSPENPEQQQPGAEEAITPPPPAKKKRRRWPWIIASIVLVLIVLVLMAPTLLGMGWARSVVVSQVNGRLNGTIEIKDWSLGWSTPVRINGIVVNDASNRQILQLSQFSTGLTLLDIVRGKYNLGQTRIEGLDILVSREADGSINWQHIAKSESSRTATERAPTPAGKSEGASTKLPDVVGELILSNCSLTYEDRNGATQPVHLRSIQADVKIPNINDPIVDSFSAEAVVGANPPGTISLSGSIHAVANNSVSIDSADVDQTIKLTGLELNALSGLLGPALPVHLAGRTDGQVVLHLAKGADGTIEANIDAQHFAAAGSKLAGSNLTTDSFTLRLPNATIHLPQGAQKAAENAKIDLGDGVKLQVANINLVQGQGASASSILKGDALNFDTRGSYTADAGSKTLHLARLNLADSQQTISVRQAQNEEIVVSLPATGNPTAGGGIDIAADLKRLNDIAQSMSAKVVAKDANEMELRDGKLAGRITFAQAAADQISLAGELAVTQLSVGNATSSPIKDEKLQISFKALANHDLSEVDPTLDATGGLISAHVTDTRFSLATSAMPIQKLKKLTLNVEIPSLPKVQALLRSFSPPKTAAERLAPGPAFALAGKLPPQGSAPPAQSQESPPMDITSGSATLTLKADPDGQNLHIVPQATVSNLGLKQGDATYSLSTIALNGDATIVPNVTGDQIQEVRVSKNDVDVNDLVVKGQPYPEKQLHLAAAMSLQPTAHVLDLKNLSLQSATTKGIALVAAGRILDLGATQKIDNVLTVDLDYDASQLLKLIVPLLSPDMQARLKDAQASGKFHKRFEVRGAYPANMKFSDAVQQLLAGADIQLDSFEGAGVSIKDLDLPFTLASGYVRIIYPDKPTGQNLPPAITLNGGTFNLGGSQIDLRGASPTLSILDNFPVLDNVSLNPIFAAWSLGTMLDNPLFVAAKDASGFLSLRVLQCRDLPLDSTLTSTNNTGTATLDLSIRQLQISGGILQNLSDVAHLSSTGLRGDVQSYRITIDHGILDQNLTMSILQNQRPLRMYGKVRLADKQLMPLTIDLPWKLFGIKGVPKEVAGFMPDGVEIPLTGTLDNPQVAFDFNKLLQNSAQKSILPGILGGKDDQQTSTQPADQPDPLKQLQDLLNRNKNKKK